MKINTARLKPWMLPIAMLAGVIFHNSIGAVAFLSPYLIFVMLLITYCKVSPRHLRLDGSMWRLLAVQVLGAAAVYAALYPMNADIAAAIFICVFCPTATAAPVITGMLGGNIGRVAVYSLLSNGAVALLGPLALAFMADDGAAVTLTGAALKIATSVLPLILGPLAISALLHITVPRVRQTLASHQSLSFYIWAVSLIIVVGNAVSFIIHEPGRVGEMLLIAALSLAVCVAQFAIGRRIGRRYGDPVAGAQSLGQKNTVLALWMTLSFLHPIVSVGPAAYIAWHNIVNSLQIWQHSRARH